MPRDFAAGGRGGPDRPDRSARPGWHGWPGNPDDLWPRFGTTSRVPGAPPRWDHDQRRHEHAAEMRRRSAAADRGRPRLSREEIVDAAIAIADAEGAEALSMRRIAQVLRAGTMSLYWHVSNKEHLLDLMRDMLMSEVEAPRPSGDWRADLRAFAISSRMMLRRHNWLMDFTGGRPSLGPTTLLTLDAALAILDVLPLGWEAKLRILDAVNTYVSGAALREVQEIRAHEAERASSAEQASEMRFEHNAWRDRLDATGLFPRVASFLDTGIDPDAPETMDARFEFGLDCLLDGIAARVSKL
jgi:AcrR family transcriptional regulator